MHEMKWYLRLLIHEIALALYMYKMAPHVTLYMQYDHYLMFPCNVIFLLYMFMNER